MKQIGRKIQDHSMKGREGRKREVAGGVLPDQ